MGVFSSKAYSMFRKWNKELDNAATALSFEDLAIEQTRRVSATEEQVRQWLHRGGLGNFAGKFLHKKGLEFFFSSDLLRLATDDVVLDAAGGRSGYLEAVRRNSGVQHVYLTDHIYSGIHELENGVTVVGGDISDLHLSDASIDKIACHHAFEHFQEDKDTAFVREAFRVLRNGGILVIIPIFVANRFLECWNVGSETRFDDRATILIDPTASLPGADEDGHFARVYDNESLARRVVQPATELGFECEVVECLIDGEPVPDMKKNFGTRLNIPMRALKMRKRSQSTGEA